jgi:hypothetical protein
VILHSRDNNSELANRSHEAEEELLLRPPTCALRRLPRRINYWFGGDVFWRRASGRECKSPRSMALFIKAFCFVFC